MKPFARVAGCLCALALPLAANAGDGRLLATGGVTEVEGSAGGGLVPWAVLAGYGTREQVGATAFRTRLDLPDYRLDAWGAAFTWHNRVELSVARDRFDLGTLGQAISRPGTALRQDVFGAKLRLAGDLVYGPLPQITLGLQHKRLLDFAIPRLVGARRDSGTDVYFAASQVLLGAAAGYNLLWNMTLRSTAANQFGLLGFGGDHGGRKLVAEGSLAVLLDPHLAVGAEYRQKPDNLSFARESGASDLFVAWFPCKRVSLTAAYVSLGPVAGLRDQRGWYLSLQGSL